MLSGLWCPYEYKNSKGLSHVLFTGVAINQCWGKRKNTVNVYDTASTLLIGPLSVR